MPDGTAPDIRPSLRVLQIGTEWFTNRTGSGAARVYSDLFRALSGQGMDLRGLVSGPSGVEALTGGRVQCFAGDGARLPTRLIGLRRTLRGLERDERFDVAASHFALYTAPVLDRLRCLPLVVHFHGPWADESAREGQGRFGVAAKRALERAVYGRAARVIVLSDAFGRLVSRRYGVPEELVRVVPGSVDLARFAVGPSRPEARRRLGWPADRPTLLSVRRLVGRMGLDRLVDAMPDIVRAEPEVLLHLVGTGPAAEALRRRVEALGLERHVSFAGFLPDELLPLAYRAADINVLPSDVLEGFGLPAAEALAAGTPSMVTPVGGLPEVVAPLSPDLVFWSGETEALSSALIRALRGELRLPDAAACQRYAAEKFSARRMAGRVAAIYREVT